MKVDSNESALESKNTAWVQGKKAKMGVLTITDARSVFVDTKFASGGTGGALGELVIQTLQSRHEANEGPLFEIAHESLLAISRQKTLLNKDRIELKTEEGTFLLNDGWKQLSPVFLRIISDLPNREVKESGSDSWEVVQH